VTVICALYKYYSGFCLLPEIYLKYMIFQKLNPHLPPDGNNPTQLGTLAGAPTDAI
jgi:hypothetical protein